MVVILVKFLLLCSVCQGKMRAFDSGPWHVFPGIRVSVKHLHPHFQGYARDAEDSLKKCADLHFGSFIASRVSTFRIRIRIHNCLERYISVPGYHIQS